MQRRAVCSQTDEEQPIAITTFTEPPERRYFEDYLTGSVYEFGSVRVTAEEIIAFGGRYDPQPFHTDPELAKNTIHGGLIASGWHTGSLAMRMLAEHFVSRVASLGSPGIDEVRWTRPVRPGDELSLRVTVLETRRSRSKPDRGIVNAMVEVLNQHRTVVMSWKGMAFYLCREAPPA